MMSEIPVVAIVARSNVGKTTLVEGLLRELRKRAYRVAVVKHVYHADVALDIPGKGSWRFARAGAEQVMLLAPERLIHIWQCDTELSLESALERVQDVDAILVEGHKHARLPKIEVNRRERGTGLVCGKDDQLIAVVSGQRLEVAVPQYPLGDVVGVADFIEERFLA
jgi:molybdopterin-guanine dinucleotide biosynthesis protein B